MSEQQPDGQPPAPNFLPPQVYGAPGAQPYAPAAQPYAAPAQPYGAPAQPYGVHPAAYPGSVASDPTQPPYGGYGQYGQPAPYGTPPYGGYPQPASTPGATIALVVISAFFVLMGLIGVPSLVIGIAALTRAKRDPDDAQRLTWAGWLVLGILVALAVVIIVIVIAVAASTSNSDDGSTIGALGTTVRPLVLRST